jgi:hypothetical protein
MERGEKRCIRRVEPTIYPLDLVKACGSALMNSSEAVRPVGAVHLLTIPPGRKAIVLSDIHKRGGVGGGVLGGEILGIEGARNSSDGEDKDGENEEDGGRETHLGTDRVVRSCGGGVSG